MNVIEIGPAELKSQAFAAMVDRHVTFCDGTAPAESCHRLTADQLDRPDITVWQAKRGDTLLGMVALKALDATNGEIKSMHTLAEARGTGIGRKLLETLLTDARARGMRALWLETGVHPDFTAARALYAAHGFTETGPFGDYVLDPHSVFMTLDLQARSTSTDPTE